METKTRKVMVRYLRTERFSNKNVNIKVELYEMDMARVDIDVKPAYRYYKRKAERMRDTSCRSTALFDYCKPEAMLEYACCCSLLRYDKVALRWLRRVMRPIVAPMLKPNGRVDERKATDAMERLLCITGEEFVLTADMLRTVKRYLPEMFANGGYRGTERFGTEIITYQRSAPKFTHPRGVKMWLRRQYRSRISTIVSTNEQLLALTRELVPDFYALLERERKLDDCTVKMRFTWEQGLHRPLLDIIVTDNDAPQYEMEDPHDRLCTVYHEVSLGTMMNYEALYL